MSKIQIPGDGAKISAGADGKLQVPDRPIIGYIEGDGIGVDISPVMQEVVDAALEKAYGGARSIAWMELYAGEKAARVYGEDQWLPGETLDAIREYIVAIKGPLTTPVGGGFRSLNVAIRQELDLYVCLRPVRWYAGVPSPVREPDKVDMVIFRENSEDIYAGIEYRAGSDEAVQLRRFLLEQMQVQKLPKDPLTGLGIKPISVTGSKRLIRAALEYTIANKRKSLTLVHKGNIMKFTEGAFKDWGYELAREEYGAREIGGGPWLSFKSPLTGEEIVVKDVIADAFLQQILLRPAEYDVVATMNLNGDYLSDALAAQVGGIGIAPGANIGDPCAVFEATHGTAPKYAGQDKVNPGSLILSAEMMLRHLGWFEAADLIVQGLERAIASKQVTYDFHRLMDSATLLSCSDFGRQIIKSM